MRKITDTHFSIGNISGWLKPRGLIFWQHACIYATYRTHAKKPF